MPMTGGVHTLAMSLRQRVGMAAVVVALSITGCGSEPAPEVTTGTLPVAASAALECDASLQQHLDLDAAVVVMKPDATEQQIEAMRTTLAGDSSLRDVTYVSKDEALAELKALFTDTPEQLDGIQASILPSSFRFRVTSPPSPSSTSDPLASYRSAPGIMHVLYRPPESWCAKADPAMLKAAQRLIDRRYGTSSLIVFMDPYADPASVGTMREALLAMPAVTGIVFVSQDRALDEFTCIFRDQPEMIEPIVADILPPSFRVDVGTDEAVITSTADELQRRPGVDVVIRRPTASQLVRGVPSSISGLVAKSGSDPDCPIEGERVK